MSTNWNCVSCGLSNALKREQCQACFSERPPECIWASRENLQFFKKYNQFPVHILNAAHYRIPCHNSLSVCHGDQYYWAHTLDEEAINEQKKVWHLNNVCWIEFKNSFKIKVPVGKYALFMRIKMDEFRFPGVWKVGNTSNAKNIGKLDNDVDEECKITKDNDCIMYRHKAGRGIFNEQVNKGWFWIYFGDFEIKEESDQMIKLCFFGFDGSWYRGLGLDVIEVYKLDFISEIINTLDTTSVLLPEIVRNILEFAHDFDFLLHD